MCMSVRLNNLAAVSTGTARAVFESANAAYRAIFEGEEDELAELSELGNELGDDLGANEETEDPNATQEPAEQPEQPPPEQSGPAPEPQNVNAQSQPASISADALIKELKNLKYDEKIRIVAQKMKRAAKGKAPDAEDMAKPVAEAIAKYMTKKGYAAMSKEDVEKGVKEGHRRSVCGIEPSGCIRISTDRGFLIDGGYVPLVGRGDETATYLHH